MQSSQDTKLLNDIRNWYKNGEVGASSSALCLALVFDSPFLLNNAPWDANDFDRCSKMLRFIPQLKEKLSEVINLDIVTSGPGFYRTPGKWKWLVENWKFLEEMTYEERDKAIKEQFSLQTNQIQI